MSTHLWLIKSHAWALLWFYNKKGPDITGAHVFVESGFMNRIWSLLQIRNSIHTFSYVPYSFPNVFSQVKVHHVNVAKVSYYNEFNYRAQTLFNEIEKGKFQEFDKDDLEKLKVLQRRAVQYVAYYVKVSGNNI